MKNYIILAVILFLGTSLMGQSRNRDRDDKIKSLKIAYITDELDLSPEASQKFWPVYNEHDKVSHEIRHKVKRSVNVDEITEQEALVLIQKRTSIEEEILAENKRYIEALKEVISAKQMVQLFEAERNFKRKMIRTLQEKKKSGYKKKGTKD